MRSQKSEDLSGVKARTTGNALIVGGAGFMGVHLTRQLLEDDVTVTVADLRRPAPLSYGDFVWAAGGSPAFRPIDVTDATSVDSVIQEVRPDTVYYLASVGNAAQLRNDPVLTEQVIVAGLVHTASAAARFVPGSRLVMASSEAVYAPPVGERLTEEASTAWRESRPYWYFSAAKAAAESFAVSFAALENLETASVRFSGVYGPGMNYGMILKEAVSAVLDGDGEVVFPHGGGFPRVWTYVDDGIDALMRAATYQQGTVGEIFHVGSEERLRTTTEMLALLNTIAGARLEIRPQLDAFEASDAANRAVLDLSKARVRLGFKPRYPPEIGLRRLMEEEKAYRLGAARMRKRQSSRGHGPDLAGGRIGDEPSVA